MKHRHSFRSCKAQYATEFMMTYGWVLVAIATIFAALYAFGIVDIGNILPEKCTLTPGFSCKDYVLYPQKIVVQITNGIGKAIVMDTMEASHKEYGVCAGKPDGSGTVIANGMTGQLSLACPLNLPSGGKERLALNFTYHFESDPTTTFAARGVLFAKVS